MPNFSATRCVRTPIAQRPKPDARTYFYFYKCNFSIDKKRSTYPYIYKQGHLNKPNSTRWLSQPELITGQFIFPWLQRTFHGSTWNGIRRHYWPAHSHNTDALLTVPSVVAAASCLPQAKKMLVLRIALLWKQSTMAEQSRMDGGGVHGSLPRMKQVDSIPSYRFALDSPKKV